MKTLLGNLKGNSSFLLTMGIALLILTNCSKQNSNMNCNQCGAQEPYQLIVDFPAVQTPGYLTLMKATILGDVTYPISISWYASKDLFPQSLQQIDTLTSGNKAWFSFMFPAIYNASTYNKGPYNIRCVVSKINPLDMMTIIEKTVNIKTAQ